MDFLTEATAGASADLSYVDTQMYDTPGYGAVFVLDAERPALIDTGTGFRHERVLAAMDHLGIARDELAAICLTHVHLDHAGGACVLSQACPNADVYVYEAGAKFIRDPARIWEGTKAVVGDRIRYYREPDPIPEDRLVPVADGESIDLGDHELVAHHAPGHAFHQVVFHDRAVDGVFCADAAGINPPDVEGVLPTTPPPNFDLEQCLEDVELIENLEPKALYYPHFGDRDTGSLLTEYSDVLTGWVSSIESRRAELGADEDVVEYFAERAEMADVWGEEQARAETRMNVRGVLHYLDERQSRE